VRFHCTYVRNTSFRITDIYAECSADYDPTSEITKQFYSKVQNKFHWANHERKYVEERDDLDNYMLELVDFMLEDRQRVRCDKF